MARIILGCYVMRFPVGGYLSWVLQWAAGFQRLGHEVYIMEKASWKDACFNPLKGTMSDDCSYGAQTFDDLMQRYGFRNNWCFVDIRDRYHGLSKEAVKRIFKSADVFVDMSSHGFCFWQEESVDISRKVLVDGEPGFTQIKMENNPRPDELYQHYDYHYTVGACVGTDKSSAPTAGKTWRHVVDPVNTDFYEDRPVKADAAFTTVMSWQAHDLIEFNGRTFGQKDVEFEKFMDLPGMTNVPLEIAVAGKNTPMKRLQQSGWRIEDAHQISLTFDRFNEYILNSRGEFSVCKNVFVANHTGFFSERSAVYLACGRPVVMQDTGFSSFLPCGRGLFAVRTPEEAADALETINGDFENHSKWAREIAREYLEAHKVLLKFLGEIGI